MQTGISRFRQRLRRAAATLSSALPRRGVSSTRRDGLDRARGKASRSRNWTTNVELFVLHSESSDLQSAAGTIHVGHALHQQIPLPRLDSLRDSNGCAEPNAKLASSAQPGMQRGGAPRLPALVDGTTTLSRIPLHWPETCTRLLEQSGVQFAVAAKNLLAANSQGLRTVALTGHVRGEGRSTVAMCLSRAVAREGGSVALLDGDTSTPDLASQLGAASRRTWMSADGSPAPETIGPPEEQVALYFRTQSQLTSTKQLDNPLERLIQAAAEKYDLVVVDLPPLDCTGRLPISCAHLDAAILVHNCRQTIPDDVCEAARSLRSMGLAAVGVAENFQSL